MASKIDRTILCFFILFLSVYFLESIGGFYMTSAIVSIEKQFQIPSKLSGMMVSAGDFGYIPAVVFVSYLGGKGNRARWIGGGCTLIAIANLMISASHFLFPVAEIKLNTSTLEREIERDFRRIPPNVGFDQFLAELPSNRMRQRIEQKINSDQNRDKPFYWISEFDGCLQQENSTNTQNETCQAFYKFLQKHNAAKQSDVDNLRLLSATSYAFCDKTLNSLRTMIEEIRCGGDISNFGPTATIFLGLLILGIGRTMPFSLGLPLIDDNVRKTNLPLYFAGMFCIRIMGPMLGFWMGSVFNKMYYKGEAPMGITPKDPIWIGRWWGGFLTIGSVLFFPSLLLFCFRNPNPAKEEENEGEDGKGNEQRPRRLALVDRHLEKRKDGEANIPDGFVAMSRDFSQTISTVLRRPVYRWAMAGRIIDVMAFKGFHIFLPKYLELQFGIPQYEINRLMGVIGVVAFAIGVLCGSLVMRAFRLQGRKAAAWVAITGAIAACFSLLNSTVGCKSTMTALGESLSTSFNTSNPCLLGCHCELAPLYPVCDRSGTVFYSPCHAGCHLTNSSEFLNNDKAPIFNGCGCAKGREVSREFCEEGDCRYKMYWYFGNMAAGGVIGGMGVVPGVLIMLRSVPPKHRSISLGFNGFLVSLLATLPSPIIWGTIIDNFCLFWSKKCNNKGACAIYATNELRVWLHSLYGLLRIISMITDMFVIYHAKGLKLTDEDEEKENNANQDENEGIIKESKRKNSQLSEKENGLLDREQLEPLNPAIVVPFIGSSESDQNWTTKKRDSYPHQKSASLPRDVKPGHKRNLSKDISSLLNANPSEFEAIRKTSNHHLGADFNII